MIYCPRCDKPLDGHDSAACGRRLSRRFFFGLCAGAVASISAPKPLSLHERYLRGRLSGRMMDLFQTALRAGDRLNVNFTGESAFCEAEVLLRPVAGGPIHTVHADLSGHLAGPIYIAPQAMRVLSVQARVDIPGLLRAPVISVVRG